MKAKKAIVEWELHSRYISKYTCPKCMYTFIGCISDRNVLRIMCKCGKILNLEHIKKEIQ